MGFIIKILLSAVSVFGTVYFLGKFPILSAKVSVDSFVTAIVVAVVLGLLNTFVKPVLSLLSLPITMMTMGLFLFILNAAMVMLASYFVSGFLVNGWISAIVFSVINSVISYILHLFFGNK
ncbi:MAG: phage holin family protein [Bacteroidetes bacterium]|nr:MAG: phage holin family protein [Bacteroidota bacterium]